MDFRMKKKKTDLVFSDAKSVFSCLFQIVMEMQTHALDITPLILWRLIIAARGSADTQNTPSGTSKTSSCKTAVGTSINEGTILNRIRLSLIYLFIQ